MPKQTKAEIVVAADTGTVDIDGVPHFVRRNVTRYRADHPVVLAAPGLFKPIDTSYPETEEMTAAPRRGR